MSRKTFDYYNFDKIYSFNAMWMFIIGARGLGKTYGGKYKVIAAAIKTGEQFVYLRRYKDELSGRGTFFADIAHMFPKYDFRVNGFQAEMAPVETADDKKRKWQVIGYFVVLSTSQNKKGTSYHNVKTIIFDEFILEKGLIQYLPDEERVFKNFYSTVDRWQDKTRVLFFANSVSIMNPYFLAYDIKPDQVGEFTKYYGGYMVCHFADSAKFKSGVEKTMFGQFIKDTEFGEFATGNEFKDNNANLIGYKPSDAKPLYNLETTKGTFSVWVDYKGPHYYIQEKLIGNDRLYTLVDDKMSTGKVLLTHNDKLMQYLRTSFRQGKAFFDTPKSRNAFIEVFRR